jgi:uncharacterized paraquat-inducible protein A
MRAVIVRCPDCGVLVDHAYLESDGDSRKCPVCEEWSSIDEFTTIMEV